MTELPQEMINALQDKEKAQMQHNWMYSFMPVGDNIYLVGYDKVCDNSVSARVPTDYLELTPRAIVTKMDIPKWGCIPVEKPF